MATDRRAFQKIPVRKRLLRGGQVLLAGYLACLPACSESDHQQARIHGTVTLDGNPIPNATIVFMPLGVATGKSTQARVVDGKYEAVHTAGLFGEHMVKIYAQRDVPGYTPAGPLPPGQLPSGSARQYLPPKYNTNSRLRADLEPGENEMSFNLTLK